MYIFFANGSFSCSFILFLKNLGSIFVLLFAKLHKKLYLCSIKTLIYEHQSKEQVTMDFPDSIGDADSLVSVLLEQACQIIGTRGT